MNQTNRRIYHFNDENGDHVAIFEHPDGSMRGTIQAADDGTKYHVLELEQWEIEKYVRRGFVSDQNLKKW